eukprot:g1420.t1
MKKKIVAVAPMVDVTTRHFRVLMRIMSRRMELYTPMLVARRIAKRKRRELERSLLRFNPKREGEGTIAQLGGIEPDIMLKAARRCVSAGFGSVNVNMGCPARNAQAGRHGASLILPEHQTDAIRMVRHVAERLDAPISVKLRIGVNEHDSYDFFRDFVRKLHEECGVLRFDIHARRAILGGLGTKEFVTTRQNRLEDIVPLRYNYAHQLKAEMPHLDIVLNGGLDSVEVIRGHLHQGLDGVMLGRKIRDDPFFAASVDSLLFGDSNRFDGMSPIEARVVVLDEYASYASEEQRADPETSREMLLKPLNRMLDGIPGKQRFANEIRSNRSSDFGDDIRRALSSIINQFDVGSQSKAVYLWAKKSAFDIEKNAITDILVLRSNCSVPDGYKLLDKHLSYGNSKIKTFLAIKRDAPSDLKKERPITDVRIVFDGNTIPGDDSKDANDAWVRVDPSLRGTYDQVHLWIRRQTLSSTHISAATLGDIAGKSGVGSAGDAWSAENLDVDEWVDFKGEHSSWKRARVLKVFTKTRKIRLLVDGHDPSWASDEQLPSVNIAPLGKHTKNQRRVETSYYSTQFDQSGDTWDIVEEDLEKILRKSKRFTGTANPNGMSSSFWSGELPRFLERCLNRRFTTKRKLRLARRSFMTVVNEIYLPRIRGCAPITLGLVTDFKRFFAADNSCKYFYDHYGDFSVSSKQDETLDENLEGDSEDSEDEHCRRSDHEEMSFDATFDSTDDRIAKNSKESDVDDNRTISLISKLEFERLNPAERAAYASVFLRRTLVRPYLERNFDYWKHSDMFAKKLVEYVSETDSDVENTNMLWRLLTEEKFRLEKWRAVVVREDVVSEEHRSCALRLQESINFFAHIGGFEAIIERIRRGAEIHRNDRSATKSIDSVDAENRKTSINEIKFLIQIVIWMRFLYTSDFAKNYFPRLQDACVQRFTSISDHELRTLTFSKMTYVLDKLADLVNCQPKMKHDEQAHKKIEILNLDITMRFLTCKIFTKRMLGAELLNTWIARTYNRDSTDEDSYGHTKKRKAKWITLSWLSKWLVENKVVELMLAPSAHVELLKKSNQVLEVLATTDSLSNDYLELIWESILSEQRGRSEATSELLEGITAKMSIEMLDVLFEKISAFEITEVRHVEIVSRFCSGAIDRSCAVTSVGTPSASKTALVDADASRRWYGLKLLWKIAISDPEESPSSRKVRDAGVSRAALRALIDLLSKRACRKSQLPEFLGACYDVLKNGPTASVPGAIELATALIKSAASSSESEDSRTLADWALKARKTSVEELVSFVKRAFDSSAKWTRPFKNKENVSGSTLEEIVVKRVHFFVFLTSHSASPLAYDEVARLWSAMCDNFADSDMSASASEPSLSVSTATLLLDTITKMCVLNGSTGFECLIDEGVVSKVFDNLLCSKSGAQLCGMLPAAMKCFRTLMLLAGANSKKVRLIKDHSTDSPSIKSFVVLESPTTLEGVETVWTLALDEECSVDGVYDICEDLLVNLYMCIGKSVENRHAVWDAYISRLMRILESSASKSKRALRLLSALDRELSKPIPLKWGGGTVDGHSLTADTRDSIQLMIEPIDFGFRGICAPNKKYMYYTIPLSETVGHLRDRVAMDLNYDPRCIVLKKYESSLNGITLTVRDYDRMTWREVQELWRQIYVDVYRLKQPNDDTKNHVVVFDVHVSRTEDDRSYARKMLSKDESHFDALFRLLANRDEVVVTRAWELVTKLPTNPRISDKIRRLSGDVSNDERVNWNDLLGSQSTDLKLLYSLQIVEEIIFEAEEAPDGAGKTSTESKGDERARVDTELKSAGEREKYRAAHKWKERFVRKGGFEHLVHLIEECDIEAHFRSSLGTISIALLLRIFSHLLRIASSRIDLKRTLAHLFKILETSSKISATPDTGDSEPSTNVTGRADVVRGAISAVVSCVSRDTVLLSTLFGFENIGPAIVFALLLTKEERVRKEVQTGIAKLCKTVRVETPDATDKSDERQSPSAFFLRILVAHLDKVYAFPTQCAHFFTLFVKLIELIRCEELESTIGSVELFARRIRDMVVRRERVESTSKDKDLVLQGMLRTLSALVRKCGSSLSVESMALEQIKCASSVTLVDHIFDECLFAIPSSGNANTVPPPKCKSKSSRRLAYDLLLAISFKSSKVWAKLCALCRPQHNLLSISTAFSPPVRTSTYSSIYDVDMCKEDRASDRDDVPTKSVTGYVGLRNLGCICYMNAMNQQLFMVPEFRRRMLLCKADEDNVKRVDDSVVYQMQRLFGSLQESEEMFYNPIGLCKALKDYDGNSVNTAVQDDASLYLTKLFQELDNNLSKSAERPTQKCFRGIIGRKKIAQSKKFPGKILEGDQPDDTFYFFSLDVRNYRTLRESLDAFFEGETVEGLRWFEKTPQEEKLETRRVPYIKKLPPHLIVHLKRFEQDWSRGYLQLNKISDRLEFPFDLDLQKYFEIPKGTSTKNSKGGGDGNDNGATSNAESAYSEEEEEEEEEEKRKTDKGPQKSVGSQYKYKLSGIVVHRGIFSSGHYYSYIRTRGKERDGSAELWHEFNDTHVTPMNPADIAAKTFGTAVKAGRKADSKLESYAPTAFLLVYDRVGTDAESTTTESESSTKSAKSTDVEDCVLKRERLRKLQESQRAEVPSHIIGEIQQQNRQMWRKRHIQTDSYFEFASKLLDLSSSLMNRSSNGISRDAAMASAQRDAIELCTRVIVGTLVPKRQHSDLVPSWLQRLTKLVRAPFSGPGAEWLLRLLVNNGVLESAIAKSTTQDERRGAITMLLSSAICTVARGGGDSDAPYEMPEVIVDDSHDDKIPIAETIASDAASCVKCEAEPVALTATRASVATTLLDLSGVGMVGGPDIPPPPPSTPPSQIRRPGGVSTKSSWKDTSYTSDDDARTAPSSKVAASTEPLIQDSVGGRRLLSAVIAHMIRIVPDVEHKEYCSAIGDYFSLLVDFSNVGKAEQRFVADVRLLPILCRKLRVATQKFVSSTGSMFDNLLHLIHLAVTSRPPNDPSSARQFLQAFDGDTRSGGACIAALRACGSSPRAKKIVMDIFAHLCRDQNVKHFRMIVEQIRDALSLLSTDYESIKPLFRGFRMALIAFESVNSDEKMRSKCLRATLEVVGETLKHNKRYYRCIETLTEYTLRLARRVPHFAREMHENASDWSWLVEWWIDNRIRPTAYRENECGTSLVKPRRSTVGYSSTQTWYGNSRYDGMMRSGQNLRAKLEDILSGTLTRRDLNGEGAYDSDDDPKSIIGRTVVISTGVGDDMYDVIQYDAERGEHFFRSTDDGYLQCWRRLASSPRPRRKAGIPMRLEGCLRKKKKKKKEKMKPSVGRPMAI